MCWYQQQLQTENQTPAADLLDKLRVLALQLGEALLEDLGLGPHVGLQLLVRETTDDVVRQAAGKGVSAKGGAMVANLHLVGDVLRHQHGADGESVAEGLGCCEDIRVSLLGQVSMGPECSGATKTGLDLIVDKNSANFTASLSQCDKELLCSRCNTALALDRLHENTARLPGNQRIDARNVVEVTRLEARQHGRKGLLVLGVRRRGQAAHSSAVEAIVERDDLDLLARGVNNLSSFAGELYSGFVGLGARVAHEYRGGVVHRPRLEGLFDEELR
ncbi:hypothetical protein HG530_011327 [Fusarium avenaceum]|nr:hypothetical protein HG530_011327 [Fusarium avenaceum]